METSMQVQIIRRKIITQLKSSIGERIYKDWAGDKLKSNNIFSKFYSYINRSNTNKTGVIHLAPKSQEMKKCFLEQSLRFLMEDLHEQKIKIRTIGLGESSGLIYNLKYTLMELLNGESAQVYFINLSTTVPDISESELLKEVCEKCFVSGGMIILITPYRFEYLYPYLGFLTYIHNNFKLSKKKILVPEMDTEEIEESLKYNFSQRFEPMTITQKAIEVYAKTLGYPDKVSQTLQGLIA